VNVALYLRRSTNERLQADSLRVQEQVLRTYATDHDMQITAVFTDSASGTTTKHRKAFLEMVERITHGPAFTAVLVRDVSRFGRFYDVDEGAFFEVLFLGHGVKTIYCEEVFTSDTSPMATLIKSVRRVMASEYSRDRSRLVRYAQSRATRLGFHAGGPPPFGMRRVMVTRDGERVQELQRGEWKALANHRTRLAPGAATAITAVRKIFELYDAGMGMTAIATTLNDAGTPSPRGKRWHESGIANVLSNSRYAGLGRYRPKRRGISDPLPAGQVEELAVHDAPGHEAIIDSAQYQRVQARMRRRTGRRSNHDLAMDARAALQRHGCVAARMLDALPNHCSWETYANRFPRGVQGALELAYASEIAAHRESVVDALSEGVDLREHQGCWWVDDTLRICIEAAFPHRRPSGVYWQLRRPAVASDVVIGICIGTTAQPKALLLVKAADFAHRTHLYLQRGIGKRASCTDVTLDDLAARVAALRYAAGQSSENRLLTVARERSLTNLSELARTLGWPHHAVRRLYWRLRGRGEWFPPLSYRVGRLVEVVCVSCGKSRMEQARRALKLRSQKCRACTRARPRLFIPVQCPKCGCERYRWPSAVRKLSSGAETICKRCRPRW